MSKTKRVLACTAVTAMSLGLMSCGTDKAMEQFNDAGRGTTNKENADIIVFPDGFSNAAHKCDGPNMVYVLFKGDNNYGAIAVVKDDPRCEAAQ